jgi:hypothetical protein
MSPKYEGAALSLCYPVNEEVYQFRMGFDSAGRGEARKGNLYRNPARTTPLLSRGQYLKQQASHINIPLTYFNQLMRNVLLHFILN